MSTCLTLRRDRSTLLRKALFPSRQSLELQVPLVRLDPTVALVIIHRVGSNFSVLQPTTMSKVSTSTAYHQQPSRVKPKIQKRTLHSRITHHCRLSSTSPAVAQSRSVLAYPNVTTNKACARLINSHFWVRIAVVTKFWAKMRRVPVEEAEFKPQGWFQLTHDNRFIDTTRRLLSNLMLSRFSTQSATRLGSLSKTHLKHEIVSYHT